MRDTGIRLEVVELDRNTAAAEALATGQQQALSALGVGEVVLLPGDRPLSAGTIGVLARDAQGTLVGGIRVHRRTEGAGLPIEAAHSPVPPWCRERLAAQQDLIELRGLWSQPSAGVWLGRRLVLAALDVGGSIGACEAVSLAHWRCFQLVAAHAGFCLDKAVPPLDYPDSRFRSVLIRRLLAASHAFSATLDEVAHG